MNRPNFDQIAIADPEMRGAVERGPTTEIVAGARRRAATALSDLAIAQLATGQAEAGFGNLQDALNVDPGNLYAVHNLSSALLEKGQLFGKNLRSLQDHVLRHSAEHAGLRGYRCLLYMPRWLNLEFVLGKCNLKCRMCLGLQSPNYPNKLSYLSADDFEAMLVAAPTVRSITLSSGDSDPLLHPEMDRIIAIARDRCTLLDIFTNGLPLGVRTCRGIVESRTVNMINFSIDAATPETYRAIRGADLDRVIRKIEMLQDMKRELGAAAPKVSMSFVAMADNIPELPAFARLAKRLGADRVFVEDVIGWENGENGNFLATDDPDWVRHVDQARAELADGSIEFDLPERLRSGAAAASTTTSRSHDSSVEAGSESSASPSQQSPESDTASDNASTDSNGKGDAATRLSCCGWLDAVYVNRDGRLDPCCLVHGVADMGNIHDGPLHKNEKYARVKDLLLTGKVFRRCAGQRMCQYVQQQETAGTPLRFIEPDELDGLLLESQERNDAPESSDAVSNSIMSLEVLPAG